MTARGGKPPRWRGVQGGGAAQGLGGGHGGSGTFAGALAGDDAGIK